MASGIKYLCGVCDKPFLSISSRNKHERVNRKCSEANSGKVKIVKVDADPGLPKQNVLILMNNFLVDVMMY